MLEATDVVKRYESEGETVEALKGVDVSIQPGEFVSIVGPSGSGKSTLLNVLGLLDVPTEGEVRLDGDRVAELSETERTRARKRTIGFVFQDFHLVPTLTARENVELPRLFDREPRETRERAEELLTRFGLGDRMDHYPRELSGGQKQRVAIARALINEPRLVLADEPTGNLDQDTGTDILEAFSEICDEGVAVVAVTHDAQVTDYTDRTLELIDGIMREVVGTDDLQHGSVDTGPSRRGGADRGTVEERDVERSGSGDGERSGSGDVEVSDASDDAPSRAAGAASDDSGAADAASGDSGVADAASDDSGTAGGASDDSESTDAASGEVDP